MPYCLHTRFRIVPRAADEALRIWSGKQPSKRATMTTNPEAERYRKYARELRYQADASRFTDIKESLLKIAQEYEAMAAAVDRRAL